ncbi:MAG TPA: NAD-dependent epimerase/dehydratase family protein [Bryobacteraceae bacterium]|jgi:nucleoside-diphosphate-sugar epimerase|nr:NAD-dependent epimerase/dehydratase family protein [Bryobacteraceae bacterium]
MNIIITGGAGYIGSRIAARLASEHAVTALDNFHRGTVQTPGVRFFEGDVRDERILNEVTRDADVIFHLAAESAVMSANADPEYCFSTNVTGTFRVLRAAEANNVRRVVFTSSREVYGESPRLPVSESAPLAPRNIYGASKAAAEMCCGAFPGEISIVRLSNVYGPGDKGRVIPLFVKNAVQDLPLTLFGARQVIDFLWIDTAVEALIGLGLGPFIPGPLNIASGKGTAISELASRVVSAAGSRSTIEIVPAREVEVMRFVADVGTACAVLNLRVPEDPLFGLPEVIQAARCSS